MLCSDSIDKLRQSFDIHYLAWKDWRSAYPFASSSLACSDFVEIGNLGNEVIPMIIEKMKENPIQNHELGLFMIRFTRKIHERESFPNPQTRDSIQSAVLWVRWWEVDRKNSKEIFVSYYNDYVEMISTGDQEDADELLQKMRRMGYDVLPYITVNIISGDISLFTVVEKLTNTEFEDNITSDTFRQWWAENSTKWLLPIPE